MKNPAAVALGRLGGKKTSEAKAAAARANAKKPRPNARGKKKPRRSDKSNVRSVARRAEDSTKPQKELKP
jgi:hypothetical protein